MGNDVEVQGSASEMFALMLHDRIVELERQLASMHIPAPDPRIDLVVGEDSQDVFVRLRCSREIDTDAWASDVCRRLGSLWSCALDVVTCQHFDIDKTFVVEAVVCFDTKKSVAKIARAAMDAVTDDALATSVEHPVVASAVMSREWFVESVRAASGDHARVVSWDPRHKTVEKDSLDIWIEDDGWCMLQGWLAHNREPLEVLHPRALQAQVQARRLWSFVARLA